MNKISYILIFTLLCSASAINCYAQESKIDSSASGQACVSTTGIYAEAVGKGTTKEEAEQAAYTYAILQIVKQVNELSPDKSKTMWDGYNPPIRKCGKLTTRDGKIEEDEGGDVITSDKSVMRGYWEYAEGIYTYHLNIVIEFYLTESEKASSNN